MPERRRTARGAARRRPRPSRSGSLPLALIPVGAVVLGGILGVSVLADQPETTALPVCEEVAPASGGTVAGYAGEQLENARAIMDAGNALGFGLDGQRLGVMAAMGESGLRNLDYGDWETSGVRNPDGTPTTSLGLFQQQEWWGSPEQRMDPTHAATLFFRALAQVEGWERMDASRAIHLVQVNADPDHYSRWFTASGEVVVSLTCAE
ncbi:hypothetical protein P0L94_16970 [Microbacter sp. GSS18]|nr:hypothetical protein P0L94_16970 [Microbacter sp. GSS18]